MTLEALVGRQLVFGLPGPDLTDEDLRLFRQTQAGGLILYRRSASRVSSTASRPRWGDGSSWPRITRVGASSCSAAA